MRDVVFIAKALVLFVGVNAAIHFPYATDGPHQETPLEAADAFYESAYEEQADGSDSAYVQIAQIAGHSGSVQKQLEGFIARENLQSARALEVGAGSGTLQDVVADYTGLDIAAEAKRFFHKPFVHGSATDLPFRDGEFDLVWSIWTLEHVIGAERALEEMRRVVREGGWLYLEPAWNNPTWAPQGYWVRDYSDLDLWGKLQKASLRIRESNLFKATYQAPIRALRRAASLTSPTNLRYRSVEANFDDYWMADSDAFNSIDCYEARLWFESRGDEAIGGQPLWSQCEGPLIIRVRK